MCIKWYSRLYRVKYHTVVNTDILRHPNNNEDLVAWDWDGTICLANEWQSPPPPNSVLAVVLFLWCPAVIWRMVEISFHVSILQYVLMVSDSILRVSEVYPSRSQSLTDRQDYRFLKFVTSFFRLRVWVYGPAGICAPLLCGFIYFLVCWSLRQVWQVRVCVWVSEQILYMLCV